MVGDALQDPVFVKHSRSSLLSETGDVVETSFPIKLYPSVKDLTSETTKLLEVDQAVINDQLDLVLQVYIYEVQEANAELYRKQNAGEVVLLEEEKTAEAQKMNAEAALFACQQAVAGELFAKQNEAEGLMAVAHAQGVYVLTLLNAFAGNYVVMKDYLMINNGVYQEIAKTNAGDVAGLKPNISVWTNGEHISE
ncbi:Flotillin-like protein [Thalictrum thalictroides]|uniref:Flotillin-like n=1 Tax=Thalictrum thalictroides TaxID=46969 RepID=A0A7J6UVG8_THATH|nr:Flotillin-like protein [Thalictrum thalictroides]